MITNIGTAHIGRLGSREAIATAKCEIVTALRPDGLVVIPAGDPLLEAALARAWQGRVCRVALADDPAPGAWMSGGDLPPADLVGRLDRDAGLLQVEDVSLALPLEGRHNARNLLLALAVGRELGLPIRALKPLVVELPGGRSRRVRLLDDCRSVLHRPGLDAGGLAGMLARQARR